MGQRQIHRGDIGVERHIRPSGHGQPVPILTHAEILTARLRVRVMFIPLLASSSPRSHRHEELGVAELDRLAVAADLGPTHCPVTRVALGSHARRHDLFESEESVAGEEVAYCPG
jgi:hypothetical protein